MAQVQRSMPAATSEGVALFQRCAARETGIQELIGNTDLSPAVQQDVEDELAEVIRQFANTPGRGKIKNLARKVRGMTLSQAFSILKAVIEKTQHVIESVAVFFTFCFDFIKLAIEDGMQAVYTIAAWCGNTIKSLLDPLVERAGGWRKVLIGVGAAILAGTILFLAAPLLL